MKNIFKKIKIDSLISGILGTLIVMILALCLRPVGIFIWKLIFSWSNSISRLITDKIIRIAIINPNFTDLVFFMCVFFLFGFLMSAASIKKKEETKTERMIKLKYIFMKFLLTSLFIFTIIFYILNIISQEINLAQRMRFYIITPYITEQKEEELLSKWYLISSKTDYIEYNNELEIIAKNNEIKLPKTFY